MSPQTNAPIEGALTGSLAELSTAWSSLEQGVLGEVAAWLATYLVHGVLLFLVALTVARFVRSARVREQLWRAALFGPLLTASLQLGAGLDPVGGRWALDRAAPGPDVIAAASPASASAEPAPLTLVRHDVPVHLLILEERFPTATILPEDSSLTEAPAPTRRGWTRSAAALLALGIGVLMLRALLEAVRMRRLGGRRRATEPRLLALVDELRERAGIRRPVRVELTERGASAYATGVVIPRIVVPRKALEHLDERSLCAMLAHELGHIARQDPAWSAAIRSVSALFFFQPLNWITAKRLEECAEFCCDELAIETTGDEVALARCLATVAGWIVGTEATAARPACAMAHSGSPLAERVERILATEGMAPRGNRFTRWLGTAAVALTALAAPGFAIAAGAAGDDASGAAELDPGSARLVASDASARALPAASPAGEVFEQLQASIALLQDEMDLLLRLCAEREVAPSTVERLSQLRERSDRLSSLAGGLQRQASARSRRR